MLAASCSESSPRTSTPRLSLTSSPHASLSLDAVVPSSSSFFSSSSFSFFFFFFFFFFSASFLSYLQILKTKIRLLTRRTNTEHCVFIVPFCFPRVPSLSPTSRPTPPRPPTPQQHLPSIPPRRPSRPPLLPRSSLFLWLDPLCTLLQKHKGNDERWAGGRAGTRREKKMRAYCTYFVLMVVVLVVLSALVSGACFRARYPCCLGCVKTRNGHLFIWFLPQFCTLVFALFVPFLQQKVIFKIFQLLNAQVM